MFVFTTELDINRIFWEVLFFLFFFFFSVSSQFNIKLIECVKHLFGSVETELLIFFRCLPFVSFKQFAYEIGYLKHTIKFFALS